MAELTNDEIDRAIHRGAALSTIEPRAERVRYDETAARIVIDLTNGCTFAFPSRLAQGLEKATAEQLRHIEISGSGYGLHWPALDVDLTVPGLVAGIFGTRAHMARLAGRVSTPAKAAAARANGARGGRPRKTARG